MNAVAIYRQIDQNPELSPQYETRTHDNTATEVLRKVKDSLGHERRKPAGSPREDREERAEHRADQDDEDRGDAHASGAGVAAAGAAVDVVVVVTADEGVDEGHAAGAWSGLGGECCV